MGRTGTIIATLVIGLLLGAVGGALLTSGAAAGAGAAAGISTGICSTTRAAQELGLLTAEQVDQVLTRAVQDVSSAQAGSEVVGSAEACADFLSQNAE